MASTLDKPEDVDEAAIDQPISVPETSDTGESGKLKMIVQLLKRCLGVKDIAAMRLSLPASLMEPIPNLEYWQYLDRPDLFAAINDSDDPFERMLAVLRFTFSKDLKFIRGKVCKPYNSVLGEHFRAHWDVIPVSYPLDPMQPPLQHLYLSEAAAQSSLSALAAPSPRHSSSETASFRSARSNKSTLSVVSTISKTASAPSTRKSTPATTPDLNDTELDARMSNLSLANSGASQSGSLLEGGDVPTLGDLPRVRVTYLTEQVSHHPPVSTFTAACPSRHLELTGIDQISAKVSGTTLRVVAGNYNKGFFVKINGGPGEGETYQITHPTAYVNGLLRGSFYITVADSTIITCTGPDGQNLRTIIEYKEESWLGRAHFLCEGVIHTYTPGETAHEEWMKVKHVPRSRVLAVFDGSWKSSIRWKRVDAPDSGYATLLDLSTLHVIPKMVRPLEKQMPTESRKMWEKVTTNLLSKDYSEATRHKLIIEQKQRDDAALMKQKNQTFVPVYFDGNLDDGIPVMTEAGRKALEEEFHEDGEYPLESIPESKTASS
ncbi:hypothetical protein EUX98_g3621 [Antrodiella citrinella]|uniref:Oxysterol-binding protein n=1 Tax=Antrodiella citrinella TaxID=2447956 RepID=A0A4S4MX51_9APHY|nr:hypothetical protein EUX98_g3621 [Antrodiella citrinella]